MVKKHPPKGRMIATDPPDDPYTMGLWMCEEDGFRATACTNPEKHRWRIKWLSGEGGSL